MHFDALDSFKLQCPVTDFLNGPLFLSACGFRINMDIPVLGPDPGKPRRLNFSEVANGPQGGPWTPKEDTDPSVEALPIAAQFLTAK